MHALFKIRMKFVLMPWSPLVGENIREQAM